MYWCNTECKLLFALSYEINTGSRFSCIILSIQEKTRNGTARDIDQLFKFFHQVVFSVF